jgi:hypothetical protein
MTQLFLMTKCLVLTSLKILSWLHSGLKIEALTIMWVGTGHQEASTCRRGGGVVAAAVAATSFF